jgi:hypothetical protein
MAYFLELDNGFFQIQSPRNGRKRVRHPFCGCMEFLDPVRVSSCKSSVYEVEANAMIVNIPRSIVIEDAYKNF